MADNTTLNSGSGGDTIASDDIGGVKHQRVKVQFGADGSATDVSSANPLPAILDANSGVDIGDVTINNSAGGSSVPVQGAAAHDAASSGNPLLIGAEYDDTTPDSVDEGDVGKLRIAANRNLYVTIRDAAGNERGLNIDANGNIAVTDGGGAITVDNGGTFAVQVNSALPTGSNKIGSVDIADISNGTQTNDVKVTLDGEAVPVTDNAGSLTIDNTNLDNLHSEDFDTGAGTDTTTAIGLVVPASGGAQVISGDATNGLDVDVTRVQGTVTVDASGTPVPVTDNGSTLSVDDGAGSLTVDSADLSTIAGAVSGTEMQVDVVASLPAGSNNIGDVDVASMPATAGEAAALPSQFVVVAGDDGTDTHPLQTNTSGDLKVTLDSETVQVQSNSANLATETTASAIQTAVELIDNAISGSEMQVDVVASLPAGSNNIGDVDIASALPAGSNTIGDVGLVGRTSGGLSIFRSIDLDETEEEIKGSAGQLFSITAFNTTDAPLYLKFYNATAANVTVGTTTPVLTFVVPGNADSDGAGFVWNNDIGLAFSTAMTVACTTGVADSDTGAPGANACIVNVGYA